MLNIIPREISYDGLLERWITDTRPDLTVNATGPYGYNLEFATILFRISDGTRIETPRFDYRVHARYQDNLDRVIEFLKREFSAFPTNTQAAIARSVRYRPRTKLPWHFR